jgi:polysaccharide export outer membrane protein
MIKNAIVILSLLIFAGCAAKEDFVLFQDDNSESNTAIPQHIVTEYKIAPRDRISVQVFKHPELSTRTIDTQTSNEQGLIVSSDGMVSLALVGRTKVVGLTKEEASELLQKEYTTYLKNPDVTVEILNQRIYVIGEVNKPGVVPLTHESMTIVEAIAQAGDINVYGERDSIKIIRGGLNDPKVSVVNMTKLASLSGSDLMLHSGDVVYIQPNTMRAVNANINELIPSLQLISGLLAPFVALKYLNQ